MIRKDIKLLKSTYSNFLSPRNKYLKQDLKLSIMLSHTSLFRKYFNLRYLNEIEKVIQRDIQEFLKTHVLKNKELYTKLFDMVLDFVNKEDKHSQIIADRIFKVIDHLVLEEFKNLNGVSFKKHIKEEDLKDTLTFYKKHLSPDSEIRNNIMLTFVRNQEELKGFQDFFNHEVLNYLKFKH